MNIQNAKEEIIHTLQAYLSRDEQGQYRFPAARQRPLLLIGPPGIGKTAIMEQIAAQCGVGLVAYTLTHHTRQSAIGLPRIVEKTFGGISMTVTEYTMSEIIASVYDTMERTGNREGILFLDEINCVSETLAPTMLQFLQNKTFGTHRLPEGWVVVAAGNPPQYNKSVRDFDVVTLDRVRQIQVEANLAVWLDYAREHHVHGAIVSYLTAKPDRFYTVERKQGEISFVTARGWEDLSQLLQSYEEMQVPITSEVTEQYLRQEDTARDFAAYYRLYRKYDSDYAVHQILDGSLPETQYREKVAMASAGSFDERVSVVNLLLEGLLTRLRAYQTLDRRTLRLHETLKRFPGMDQTLPVFLDGYKKALAIKEENGLISREDARTEQWVLHRLKTMSATVAERRLKEPSAVFACLKEQFQLDLETRQSAVQAVRTGLENSFRFAEDGFGEGPELTLLVTSLTKLPEAQEYLCLHGCDAYLRHSGLLLYRQREETLRKACLELL